MGFILRRQLREALGPHIKGVQRAVALEIADDANDKTRLSWASLDDLARWTAAGSTDVVRNALKRLASVGWEFRVPLGKGKDGRILYAVPGKRLTFYVPLVEGGAPAPPEGGATAPPSVAEGGAGAPSEGAPAPSQGARAPSEGAPAPPFSSPPQDSSSLAGAAAANDEREIDSLTQKTMAAHDATAEEVRAILTEATSDGVRNVAAWLSSEAGHEDFARRLVKRRARRDHQHAAARDAGARRAAINSCTWCDDEGWRKEDGPARRCDHLTPPTVPKVTSQADEGAWDADKVRARLAAIRQPTTRRERAIPDRPAAQSTREAP